MRPFCLFLTVVIVGCSYGSPYAPPSVDSGRPPMADSGHLIMVDAGTPPADSGPAPVDAGTPVVDSGSVVPTPWRPCGDTGVAPTRFSVLVLDGTDGPLGHCPLGWDPFVLSMPPDGRDIGAVGSDLDLLVEPAWAGAEADVNFRCGGIDWASLLFDANAESLRVLVRMYFPGESAPRDVSALVRVARNFSGHLNLRVPLCSTHVGGP